jgi:PAS domain S-box-containing protein
MKALIVGDTAVDLPGMEIERISIEEAGARLERGGYDLVVAPAGVRLRPLNERAAAEVQQRAEAEHRAFVERTADGVFTHRRDLTFAYVNPAFVAFLGYSSPSELLERHCLDLIHADDRPMVRERIEAIFSTRQPSKPREIRFLHRDGSILYAETRGILVETAGDAVITVMSRDLTEQKRATTLEEQLHQSQKMEVVGRLAGGVAHDFNNILTTIRGYGDLLLERIDPDSPAYDAVQHIRRSATRAAALTEQLLVFTRRRPPQPRVVQLNDVLRHMGGLLRRVIGEDIRLELRLDARLPNVRVDPGQIEQMVLNLAINARDAMDKGGRLSISTADLTGSVRITVEDDGIGMDEDTRRHIFEPFFTTKGIGKGTGLGLSIVHAIVEQSGGSITVDSAPGRGARFSIVLPSVNSPREPRTHQTPMPTPAPPRGTETILLAEDDDEVRDFVEHVLRASGYHVLCAPDGSSALRSAQAFPGEISLLLSDVVMPNVNGRQLAEQLQALRPKLRVLHMSGYPGDTIARYGDVRDGDAFLQKPFSARELAEKVRDVLDGRRTP